MKAYDVAEESPSYLYGPQPGIGLTDGLAILAQATKLYDELPGATASISVPGIPLHKAKWYHYGPRSSKNSGVLSRSSKFACIAMFESGNLNLDPDSIGSVMAMSSGNSIFTLTALLQDLSDSQSPRGEVTRILGNLDRPGIVVLVPPQAPLVRICDPAAWRIINHAPFDGKQHDSFPHTSLHLSFTQYEMPLIVRTGTVDAEITVLESPVSVYDRQQWTADIDVVGNFADVWLERHFNSPYSHQKFRQLSSACPHGLESRSMPTELFAKHLAELYCRQLISIDSWEELLDPPERLGTQNIGVFRAADNWQAKLAAFSICWQLGYQIFLKPKDKCDACILDTWVLRETEIFIL